MNQGKETVNTKQILLGAISFGLIAVGGYAHAELHTPASFTKDCVEGGGKADNVDVNGRGVLVCRIQTPQSKNYEQIALMADNNQDGTYSDMPYSIGFTKGNAKHDILTPDKVKLIAMGKL
ncbi:hypothetical protein FAI40_03940 [Acetobacteraceae bacterium]|nr:hypothetical protein FAI40_03940 [Acetobacteraceae bacterium]